MSTHKRLMRPRPLLVVAPLIITDENSFAGVGLTPRQFRDVVTRFEIRHRRVGQRILVRAEDILAFVAEQAGTTEPAEGCDDDDFTVDDILRSVGRKRSGKQ